MREKNMAKYKFSNKLMFALVMQDEEICAEFIQRLFPGKKVKSITFPNDIQITPEKTIVTGVLSKSVRLDVLFESEAEVYDMGRRVPRAKALHSWHETCLAFFVNNKDFDEWLIVTYSIKYRNYLRKIREKQVIRAKKTLHNGKVHAKRYF